MHLQTLSILNFKNIEEAKLDLSPRINCLVGDNGTGKTNLLDAVHYLSMGKSAFGVGDLQCLRHGAESFMIEGLYRCHDSDTPKPLPRASQHVASEAIDRAEDPVSPSAVAPPTPESTSEEPTARTERILCAYRRTSGKKLSRGGKEYDKLSEHIGLIPIVTLTPSDTSLINESGDERRRYLNSFISQLDRTYLTALVRYNRLLGERNRLLKMPPCVTSDDLLEVIDLQMCDAATTIHAQRRQLIDRLAPCVGKYYATLSNDREEVTLLYRSELNDRPMDELLKANRQRDHINQFTTGGIHRDDMRMLIGGYPLRKYGSQGQQKSFLAALKLAQFDIVAAEQPTIPILLLDDIFDKLDVQRVEQLLSIVTQGSFGQIFITDCDRTRLEKILMEASCHYTLFTVKEGHIEHA